MVERTDVLIVGAGPAGLAAAIELRRRGVRDVLVVDRESEAGGIPRFCHHTGFGIRDLHRVMTGPAYAARYRQRALEAGVVIRTSTTVTGWQNPSSVAITSPSGLGQVEAKAILLATGCRERPRNARLVPGDRPHGVLTTGSLQRLVCEKLPVGNRAVINGAELVSLSALSTLHDAGVSIAAMVTEQPRHQIYMPFAPMKWLQIDWLRRAPILTKSRITNINGRQRVESVEIMHDDSERIDRIECDTVVFTGDWIPEHELSRTGGLSIDAGSRGPQTDAAFRTSARGVFAAGNLLRGVESASTCALEGRAAAGSIGRFLDTGDWPAATVPVIVEPPLEWIWPNALAPDESPKRFSFRCREFRRSAILRIQQNGRLLQEQRFSRLVVNETMQLKSDWVREVRFDSEPVVIAVPN